MDIHTSEILGVPIYNRKFSEVSELIKKSLKSPKSILTISTPNPEILVKSAQNSAFHQTLRKFDLALPDGLGIVLAGKLLGKPFEGVVGGVYLMEELVAWAAKNAVTVGLIGGFTGVALEAGECLTKGHPRLAIFAIPDFNVDESGNEDTQEEKVMLQPIMTGPAALLPRPTSSVDSLPAGARQGTPSACHPSWETSARGNSVRQLIVEQIERSKQPAIIFVAFGAPKQEFFIEQLRFKIKDLRLKSSIVLMTVGGAFDEIAGRVPRAPQVLHRIGLKWLWRLIWQPWRVWRQLRLLSFIKLVVQEYMRAK